MLLPLISEDVDTIKQRVICPTLMLSLRYGRLQEYEVELQVKEAPEGEEEAEPMED